MVALSLPERNFVSRSETATMMLEYPRHPRGCRSSRNRR
jgi:hypothetical protein